MCCLPPGLRHIPGVQVYVDMEDLTYKDLIVAMGIEGIEFAECARRYLEHGVTLFERVKSSTYSKRIILQRSSLLRINTVMEKTYLPVRRSKRSHC